MEVRLRYAFVVKCVGVDKDASGNITAVHCTYDPQTRSGTPGAEARKVKGNIHWLSVAHAREAEVRLYDRLFVVPQPGRTSDTLDAAPAPSLGTDVDDDSAAEDTGERSYLDDLNPHAKKVVAAFVEPSLAEVAPETRYQFERHGYFVADMRDSRPGAAVFNRAVTLRDSWGHK
jgi:glutaminyl-tRNA synthetase